MTTSFTTMCAATAIATTTINPAQPVGRAEVRAAAAERRRQRLSHEPLAPAGRSYRVDYRSDWTRFLTGLAPAEAAGLEAELAASQGVSADDDIADQVLATAVRRAATDEAAARLVLQRILPGLLAIARRRARFSNQVPADVLHDIVATAWIAIRTFPIERRPCRIAANLVRDAEYLLYVKNDRVRHVDETASATLPDLAPATAATSTAAEIVELLADGRAAGLDPNHLALFGRLALTDVSVGDLATELAITPRTVLNRRRAVEQALAEVYYADLAA
jgi:hypothetical protein